MTTLWQCCSKLQRDKWPGKSQREVSSRVLNFCCKEEYRRIKWESEEALERIRLGFQTNENLVYRWSVVSPNVDTVARSLEVSLEDLERFLEDSGFDIEKTYTPDRGTRKNWLFKLKV